MAHAKPDAVANRTYRGARVSVYFLNLLWFISALVHSTDEPSRITFYISVRRLG